MWIEPNEISVEMVKVLNEQGDIISDQLDVTDKDLITMYKFMVLGRVLDEKALKLQRQGRIGTFAPVIGQEAAQVGSAYALSQSSDWIFPSYRDFVATTVHGLPISQFFLYTMGHQKGASTPEGVNVFPPQIIIAAQTIHAMGSAWASRYLGEEAVSVAYVGDGGTSEGDFHEALNLAAVNQLPAIFFVQNNQYAISLPVKKQTASSSIAQKALAYGIAGIQVDGNDLIAVHQTMKQAVERAKKGQPVLIEAITFRRGPHSTADDPTKYRHKEEENNWVSKDPLERVKRYLMKNGLWDETKDKQVREEAEAKVADGAEMAFATPKSSLSEAFDVVYHDLPSELKIQRKAFE